jgi:hypothetical protein
MNVFFSIRVRCHTVVGAPIELPKLSPEILTDEAKFEAEVLKWHGIYIEALTKLYNDNNEKVSS